MKVQIHLEQLYETNPRLFNQIKNYFGARQYGVENVDLPIAFAEAVKRWQDTNPVELWEAQQAQVRADEAKLKAEKDQAEALKRIDFWSSQGLLATDANIAAVRNFIVEKCGGRLSAETVDTAINTLRDQLAWAQPAAPVVAPAPPVEPPPPPVILSDGSEQLPLGTAPRASRHTLVQLKDLARREQEERARQVRVRNNEFVAKFNKEITIEV